MERDRSESIGWGLTYAPGEEHYERLLEYVNLKLAARGLSTYGDPDDYPYLKLSKSMLANFQEKNRLLSDHLCPADAYVNEFLNDYLVDVNEDKGSSWLPSNTLVLERHGLSRILSLPPDQDMVQGDILTSYRVQQGVLHNPINDRRTTKGVFHVCEGGFPVPADKREVPKIAFARLLRRAFQGPREMLRLPFTASQEDKAETMVSIMLRPMVCPEVPGVTRKKTMETRFFVPGNFVANLDFVESIFGNAGDPFISENNARLDADWSGHSGCVILAPHLKTYTKKELGLPHVLEATDRQKKDGMCWEKEDELYNDGGAFKITCRNHRGVVVTLIADNYFGYCKKEVKTQISYAANLNGLYEEEHAGGALAFPRFDLGEDFRLSRYHKEVDHTMAGVLKRYGKVMHKQEEGYAIDRYFPDIFYVPDDVHVDLRQQTISWQNAAGNQKLKLLPGISYVLPSGYKVEMVKPVAGTRWRIVGTTAEGTFCHKPCTVSGGGKSEISKPITDAMISGPIIIQDFEEDFNRVEEIIERDYSGRYKNPDDPNKASRPLLSPDRSLGSVMRLLTPNAEYTDEYNQWLSNIPRSTRDLVLIVKRFYRQIWEKDWRKRFSVDIINGRPGYELKYRKQKLITQYLRVGFTEDGSWRTYSLRKDFFAAFKLQTEDDITASTVVPPGELKDLINKDLNPEVSQKFSSNCEFRLFQRPDEAIVRGYDKTAEADFGRQGNFFSNYEPLSHDNARAMMRDVIEFDKFTEPMQAIIHKFNESDRPDYFMSTSHPRLVNGVPTKNPRYLQDRPDLHDPRSWYLADMGARMHRRLKLEDPAHFPVTSVLAGRRNNPPDKAAGIRTLAVYSPLHYQELPELFMDFIASLTGKSPSTTGAGSEGALTKGPFNCLPAIIDLNNALVAYLVCNHGGFSSAAGHIGHKYRVDHDISLLIPEVWSRMFVNEREPQYLIKNEYLEPLKDFEHNGKPVLASRLGYRITQKFVNDFFGRMFSGPDALFEEDMLRPELQDLDDFADGVSNIVETHQRVAKAYIEDGTIELACPPLKALLYIMADGQFEGMTAQDPEFRKLFTLEDMQARGWYQERLTARQQVAIHRAGQLVDALEVALEDEHLGDPVLKADLEDRLASARMELLRCEAETYLEEIQGTLGTDPAVLPEG